MKHNPIDKAMLLLVAIVVLVITGLNLCQTDRPTVSETENRNLATMPEFSVSALLDGSYFSDTAKFFSDTFYARETLVRLSKKMDRLKSLSLFYTDEDDFSVIIDPNATKPPMTQATLPTLPPLTQPTTQPTTSPWIPPFPTDPDDPTHTTQKPTEPVIPLLLSDSSASIISGATHVLTAQVGEGYGLLTWKSSNVAVATVTPSTSNTATVAGIAAGTAEITATVSGLNGEVYSLVCTVTVTEPQIEKPDEVADFLPNGMIIYNGAAYTQSYFAGASVAKSFASVYDRYAQLFPNATVSVVPAPLATITITDPKISSQLSDQGWILDQMEKYMTESVHFVNLKGVYKDHATEYLFYKSDHHWTHRGAYYAYAEFVRSRGMEPTPIEEFEVKILNTKYIGSMAYYTGDDRVKSFYDTVEAYLPTKDCTMTIYGTQWGTIRRNYCIDTAYTNYLAFLMGDNGYTVINVPENPQDKSILVIKDSYGNAFVPYLTEHYGNIYVVDPRHVSMDILEEFQDKNLTDIVFMTNSQSANNTAWYNYYYKMIT